MAQLLIIGHRGAAAVAPENTIGSFNRALRDGADGIEFDVMLAGDGVPVVIHDPSLKRTAEMDAMVAELSSSKLSKINVGAWFNSQNPAKAQAEYAAETLPTLDRVFEVLRSSSALFYLEMKADVRTFRELALAVVKSIHNHALTARVIVSSFNLLALEEVKGIDSAIKTAALFEPKVAQPLASLRKKRMVGLAKESGTDEIALHYSLANQKVIEQAKQADLGIVVWTVDNPDWVARASKLGLRGLITNDPAAMISGSQKKS